MQVVDFYKSGYVQRYHQNADLARFGQQNSAHQWGVAVLIMMLNPDASHCLIRAALTHDVGEYRVGDLSQPFKASNPDFAKKHSEVEDDYRQEIIGQDFAKDLNKNEISWLKTCDRLEAILFAFMHNPSLRQRRDWQEAIAYVISSLQFLNENSVELAKRMISDVG